jgi:hypothetical protein
MQTLLTQTRKQLSELGSPDEFEALVTGVLRAAVPGYAALHHVGTNASGRAVRSPVDGIGIHRNGSHLVLVQHTITARRGLRRKWLGEKDGDVVKAREIFRTEIARGSVASGTLVLACSTDPDEKLIRDVHATVADGLKVDLWSGSRIADFLDRHPEGQWLRERQFGTEALRLSVFQARAISEQSLNAYLPLVARGDSVPRALDAVLAEFARKGRGTGFVIGESGLGKSVGLRRLADEWLSQGGVALILAHELIEQASTIEQAIAAGLRQWAPSLELGCGHSALGLSTAESPILLIVEDVNRSPNPRRIIERLIGWSAVGKTDAEGGLVAKPWRLLCPVWRGNAELPHGDLRDHVMRNSLVVDRFERKEAVEAIRGRAIRHGIQLTALQCNDLAAALGDDPLLIGLNRDWSSPSPQTAMQSFVTTNIDGVADDRLLASDLRHALDELAGRMVEQRAIYPKWRQIRGWLAGDADMLAAIRRLIDRRQIIHLNTGGADERLAYRHDRVRDYLLTQALARLIGAGRLTPELWSDPWYAALIGGALPLLPASAISETATYNPVALFAALQGGGFDDERRRLLIEAAQAWISSPAFSAEAADQQRHHAIRFLARTDGTFVAGLAKGFPFSSQQLEVLVRNGSARAGAALCLNREPGFNHPWRDRVIAHAVSRHPGFVPDLAGLIRNPDCSGKLLEGALYLAGEIGDPALCDALAARWTRDGGCRLSMGWLWAVLRCCPPVRHPLATTLCDLWATLPAKERQKGEERDSNPRWDIAGYSLPWAFARKPEPSAIAFLIARAKQDRRLEHVLSSILQKIDLPEAVIYVVRLSARISRRVEKNRGVNLFASLLESTWSPERRGRALSAQSRAALAQTWRNRRLNRFDRRSALFVWCLTPTREDLAELAMLEADSALADTALRTRLSAGDQSAIPLLRQRIWSAERGGHWWYHARRVGLAGLREDIQRYLEEHRIDASADGHVTDHDHILAELLMDSRDEFAVQTIIANWPYLKKSPLFVQAALYLATPETVALARSAITESAAPEKMLEHIDMNWGIKTDGRAGVVDLRQLEALEPYYGPMSESEWGDLRIISFFEAANGLGALGWRRKHLDPLIAKCGRGHCTSDKQSLFGSLDDQVALYVQQGRHWFSIDRWFEWREEELCERSALLAIVGEWACAQASSDAVALLCEALLYFGERRDLTLLERLSPALRASCAPAIANCTYGVRQRSLASE